MTSALKGNPVFQTQPQLNLHFLTCLNLTNLSQTTLKKCRILLPLLSGTPGQPTPPPVISRTRVNPPGHSFQVSATCLSSQEQREALGSSLQKQSFTNPFAGKQRWFTVIFFLFGIIVTLLSLQQTLYLMWIWTKTVESLHSNPHVLSHIPIVTVRKLWLQRSPRRCPNSTELLQGLSTDWGVLGSPLLPPRP